jgi:hypothetical protein
LTKFAISKVEQLRGVEWTQLPIARWLAETRFRGVMPQKGMFAEKANIICGLV